PAPCAPSEWVARISPIPPPAPAICRSSINGNPPNITNPADFVTPATPFVMFATGSATATLTFDAVDDALAEGTESFFIGIAPGDGLSYSGFGTTTGIIIDNDAGA